MFNPIAFSLITFSPITFSPIAFSPIAFSPIAFNPYVNYTASFRGLAIKTVVPANTIIRMPKNA
jgi:hypothetical protein